MAKKKAKNSKKIKTRKAKRRLKVKIKSLAKKPTFKSSKFLKKISFKSKKSKIYNLANIKVIGIGGAGGNAVTRMYYDFPKGVNLTIVNTDIQDLDHCLAKKKICIGRNLTRGLGTGMNPELGKQAVEESREDIVEVLKGTDIVFLTAGYGGGTGTGALPEIADIAKDLGILTVAIITKPFSFEGYERQRISEEGIMKTRDKVDTLIVIPNDQIFSIINQNTSLVKAFAAIDEVLSTAVGGITDLIMNPGIINVDFADVKTIMQSAGSAIIGIGVASGNERAQNAASLAINSPLLEFSLEGARGVLLNISGQRDLKMSEVNDIARMIAERVDQSARIIFGAHHDRKLKKGEIKVTLVATGFERDFKFKNQEKYLPSLFVNDSFSRQTSEFSGNKEKTIKKEEKQIIDENNKNEEIWDIPTFLRKKKK
ncbi:MAG: cell division protein FtsZ [Patescibacteria group bacterium]